MSKAQSNLLVGLELLEVERVAKQVVVALGWELERKEVGTLVVHEDAARLHCHCSPLRAELDLRPISLRRTEVSVKGKVAGWGPLSSQHVREQTDLLTRRLGLAVIKAARGRALDRGGD